MNVIKKAYQYLFYKLYKFFQSIPYPWLSEWKAALVINFLFIFILLSCVFYYTLYIDRYVSIESVELTLIGLFLIINTYNYFLFLYKNKWKRIVLNFDQLPKKKDRIGNLYVSILIGLIIANFVYSFYSFIQVDWSQYPL